MKKASSTASSKKKTTASSPSTPLPNVTLRKLKEFDIVSSIVNDNDNNNNSDDSSVAGNKTSNCIIYNDYVIVGYENGVVRMFKFDKSNTQFSRDATVEIPAPALNARAKQQQETGADTNPLRINYLHVDKMKKWLFVNYRALGLYVYELPGAKNSSELQQQQEEVKLVAHNILNTTSYYAVAVDELYKNERLAIVTQQALYVYSYVKPASIKPDFRTGKVNIATKVRSVHMSLTHLSEHTLQSTYLKFVGNYLIIGQPLAGMTYTCVELDSVQKGTYLKKQQTNELQIEDLTKSASDSSSPVTPTSTDSPTATSGGRSSKSKSSNATIDTIIPTRWPMFGKLDDGQLPEVFRIQGKMVLLRAGKNRLVPGDLSGLLLTYTDIAKNPELQSKNKESIVKKYSHDENTGINNRYILDEIVFDSAPDCIALSGILVSSVTIASDGQSIILDTASIIEPVPVESKDELLESESEHHHHADHVRVQLPIKTSPSFKNAASLIGVGNGDFVFVSDTSNLYYIQAKYQE